MVTSTKADLTPGSANSGRVRALRLDAADNVVTLLADCGKEPVEILGDSANASITAVEAVQGGHKIAMRALAKDEPVVKYGVTIGLAMEPIAAGAWVHTHNCKSRLDERSHTLDRHTGAPTDTRYV